MSKKAEAADHEKDYEQELRLLQIELVKLQRQIISGNLRLLVILEGRDTAGKDGTIKRIVEHLSPRETRVVALNKPSSREEGEWYFQRYVAELPSAGEFAIFNRSWYNRAGVEQVMGFCTEVQYKQFMGSVNEFESLLVDSGTQIMKYYLDIDKKEQA
ncbi:polyphosphate kinase 2, partial [Polynucleobacter sp. UK-Pondora-W15]|nr:polyphosphate kinase 2 [Polynucleobacter alcilacus]